MAESLVLVVNPGSASRKYALFANGIKKANVHFEFVNDAVVGTVESGSIKHSVKYDDTSLENVSKYILALLQKYEVIDESETLSAVGIRIVAPSDNFAKDQLLTDEIIARLESLQQKAPLHITTALSEIKHLKNVFVDVPLIAISDSAFHTTKPEWATYYGIDTELAEKFGIKRYGYHGVSVGSVVNRLQEADQMYEKTIICHLGSGSSVTALINGKSMETTMGYSPLEGLMMSTRSGNLDVAAALALKRNLHLYDNGLEQYLNKSSGLMGVSGKSDDIRQLLVLESQNNKRATLALKLFVYKIQQAIGQMASSIGGADCLVFTATIGERSCVIRERILEQLAYLGFENNKTINDATFEPKDIVNIGAISTKPVLVVATDESAEIAKRAENFIH